MNITPKYELSQIKTAFIFIGLTAVILVGILFSKVESDLTDVRTEVVAFLSNLNDLAVVRVNGDKVEQPELIIDALLKIEKHNAHHSHPEEHLTIQIQNGTNSLELVLGRDSEIKTEYWVFNPKANFFKDTIIGSIQTEVLNNFPNQGMDLTR